jgi:hypothetical protein
MTRLSSSTSRRESNNYRNSTIVASEALRSWHPKLYDPIPSASRRENNGIRSSAIMKAIPSQCRLSPTVAARVAVILFNLLVFLAESQSQKDFVRCQRYQKYRISRKNIITYTSSSPSYYCNVVFGMSDSPGCSCRSIDEFAINYLHKLLP